MNEMVDNFSNRLNEAIRIRNIKPIELSVKTGIDKSKISSYMSGRYKAKQDGVYLLAEALNVSEAWLMGLDVPMNKNTNKKEKGVKVPVLGYIKAGIPIEAIEDIIDYEEIPETLAKKGKFFALKVKGDSMEPDIKNGDIAILLVQPDINSGEIGAVIFNGNNEATLKRIYKDETGITLIPDNLNNKDGFRPTHYTNKEIKEIPITIAGKLMEVRKKYY